MLTVKDLTFAYHRAPLMSFPDIQCEQGDKWLLLGQSGCGKTTLLHLIAGLLPARDGKIVIHDQEITAMNSRLVDKMRGKLVGVVFQQSHLIQALNIEQNLLAAQYCAGMKPDRKRVFEIISRLRLEDKLWAHPSHLSQGQRQRVAIARALVNKPSLILADEPTSSLDDIHCQEVIQLLEEQAEQENATLLIVTHDNRLKEHFSNQIILTPHEPA